jgi:hypothetical protein
MGPKRKRNPPTWFQDAPGQSSNSKKSRNNPEIDYDKLADAILSKQSAASALNVTNEPVTSTDTVEITGQETEQSSSPMAQPVPPSSAAVPVTPVVPQQAATSNDFVQFIGQLFTGESGANSISSQATPIALSDGIPLSANIPPRIKQKIWSDQFIEFKTLLPNHKDQTVSIQIEHNSFEFF